MSDDSSGVQSASYQPKTTTSSDFMFHYAFFGCLGAMFLAVKCYNRLRTVSGTGRTRELMQIVHNRLPSVAKRGKRDLTVPEPLRRFLIN
jgi:hypothetical protein